MESCKRSTLIPHIYTFAPCALSNALLRTLWLCNKMQSMLHASEQAPPKLDFYIFKILFLIFLLMPTYKILIMMLLNKERKNSAMVLSPLLQSRAILLWVEDQTPSSPHLSIMTTTWDNWGEMYIFYLSLMATHCWWWDKTKVMSTSNTFSNSHARSKHMWYIFTMDSSTLLFS